MDCLFPSICLGCGKEGHYICATCLQSTKAHPEICPFCHIYSRDYAVCHDCRLSQWGLQGIMIGFDYSSLVKKLILALKYYHRWNIAEWFGSKLALLLQTNTTFWKNWLSDYSIVTHIPSHRTRKYFTKWYNQSELLAKELAKQLWLKYLEIAKKQTIGKQQTGKKRIQRLSNMQGFFEITMDIPKDTKTILIVDDILTTWATLLAMAQLIKFYYPDIRIWWIVVARSNR